MASPASRSPAPLVFGAVTILILAGGVFWLLDDAAPTDGSAEPSSIAAPEETPGESTVLPDVKDADLPELIESLPTQLAPGEGQTAQEVEDLLWDEPLLITGTVEDPAEKRLADVTVNLFDEEGEYFDSESTDDDGVFRFYSEEGLTAGWSLATEPELGDPDDPTVLMPAFHTHDAAVVPSGSPVHVALVLSRPARIEGKVYDAETGDPISMADIEVVCQAMAWDGEFQDDYTDEAGFFGMNLVDVPATDIMLRVMDDDDRYAIFGPISLQPGEVRVIDVGLRSPPSLAGTVISASDGTPIDGAEVNILPAHSEFEGADAWDITGDEGEFFIDDVGTDPENLWLLVTEVDEYGPTLVRVNDVSRPVDVQLHESVTVAGRVRDALTNEPVIDTEIRFVLMGPSGLMDEYEDMEFGEDDGTFAITLESCPPEGAIVIVIADDYLKFRQPLRNLAPTELKLNSYTIDLQLTPLAP